MEKVTQEGKKTNLEGQVLETPSEQPVDGEAFKVNSNPGLNDEEQERINTLRRELEEAANREQVVERPNIHVGDNNTHLNRSVNISNTINNGGNSGGGSGDKNREAFQEKQEEPKGFIEKYFGKIGKGLFKIINPLFWLRILNTKIEKK
jgi:hypothetical protein